MMEAPLITLTTDFGEGSPYVAAMKGVILSINPTVQIVDITHKVPPQDIGGGALVLHQTTLFFPPGTIHVAVVDPGVGTSRAIAYTEMAGHRFIAPDNGLLNLLAADHSPTRIVHLTNKKHWLADVSPTFHGRDIMAPVAARLSLGLAPEELGRATERLRKLDRPETHQTPKSVVGQVVAADSFGNLVTNVTEEMLAEAPRGDSLVVRCDGHETRGLFNTYADQPPMTLVALIGSSGRLELAVVNDNAAAMLGVGVGAKVVVSW